MKARAALALLLTAAASGARAQTMLDQEERLIEIHSLLVALPALEAPGALTSMQGRVGLELVIIPVIDGTTGGKEQITASDKARVFPRLRLGLGLPIGGEWSAVAGAAWIPPVEVNQVTVDMIGLEAGVAWSPRPFAIGLRLHGEYADSRSPVTDPSTRDQLITRVAGADLSAAWRFNPGPVELTPYASIGVARVDGRFAVTSDGYQLSSTTTNLALSAGLRLQALRQLELVAELVAYPGVLVHPNFSIAWVPRLGKATPPPEGGGVGETRQ